jgi:hypothetical protein
MLVAGCQEDLTAPGTCPEYCPAKVIDVFDSVFVGSVYGDTAYVGYVLTHRAGRAQVVTDGVAAESRAINQFQRFSSEFNNQPIAVIDSFRLTLAVLGHSSFPGLELVMHHLPVGLDSTTTYADLDPFFDDSTQIGVLAIPDSLTRDTISVHLPGDAFPTLVADSMVTALGFRIASGPEGWADLGTIEAQIGAQMAIYVKYVIAGDSVEVNETRLTQFDSYVSVDQPAMGPDILAAGGAPSWRSFLRFDIPSWVTDSSDIARATLILVPSEPILGAAGDSVRLRADALTQDVGSKSPILVPGGAADTLALGSIDVNTGWSDTLRIDVTHILKLLRQDLSRPHSIALWVVPQAGSVGQARFWSSRNAASAPALAVTWTPLFPREGQ